MPRETITIAAGQCGNQQSANFWERLCLEHGIASDGLASAEDKVYDRKEIFFCPTDDGRYIPRSIMLDLESKVIQRVRNSDYGALYSSENLFIPETGGTGAGNNWAAGYTQGEKYIDQVLDMLDRETENCESLEAFTLFHALAGGTGSGLGSLVLERIRDNYPKKILQAVSVLPSSGESGSEVVVQPYNSVLTLQRLSQNADVCFLFDNKALKRIKANTLAGTRRDFGADIDITETNIFVTQALLAATAPIRFPGFAYNNWSTMLTALSPSPQLHFIVPAYTPFISPDAENSMRFPRKTSVTEILHRLVQAKHSMLAVNQSQLQDSRFISILRVIRGDSNDLDYRTQILTTQERDNLKFSRQFVPSSQIVTAKCSPFIDSKSKLSGVGLWNNSIVGTTLEHVLAEFNSMFKKNAFINSYRQYPMFENDSLEEFNDAQACLESVIEEYQKV